MNLVSCSCIFLKHLNCSAVSAFGQYMAGLHWNDGTHEHEHGQVAVSV